MGREIRLTVKQNLSLLVAYGFAALQAAVLQVIGS